MSALEPTVAELERERVRIFAKRPIAVTHLSLLRRAGDFTTQDVMGVPLLLSRGRSGTSEQGDLHAFVNVCRHRATRLVPEACGRDRLAFVCKLHGYTYDLEGHLFHVPADGADFVDKEKLSLGAVPVTESLGFAWVTLARGVANDPAASLGVRSAELEALNLGARTARRVELVTRRIGWKSEIETILSNARAAAAQTILLFPNAIVVMKGRAAAAFHVLPTSAVSCKVFAYGLIRNEETDVTEGDELLRILLEEVPELDEQTAVAFRAELDAALAD